MKGSSSKPDHDFGKASERGDYEWSPRIKRVTNPSNGSVDGPIRENPSWTYGEDRPGPIPRRGG